MLEQLLSAFLRSQFGDIRRRTTGVLIEGAALGMAGLATVFLFLGAYVWLSVRIDAWVAAFILAGVALVLSLILLLVGKSMVNSQKRRQDAQALAGLEALGLLPRSDGADPLVKETENGPALVGAALLAGVMMGRSLGR